jgi:Na+-transporting NADH:ubiquinone oxidoreductase subunit C
MLISEADAMNEFNPFVWWRRLLALPNTSGLKAVVVVLLVSMTCAIIVSVTAVTLRPIQQANLEAERKARLTMLLRAIPGIGDQDRGAEPFSIKTVVVDLATGSIVESREPLAYDQRATAGTGRRAQYAPIHVVRRNAELALVILPVHGPGYQSTLYGYLALKPDLKTIAALTFYEQAETPGLGDRITEPAWLSKWPGTEIADEEGNLRVAVVQGDANRPYEVEGISGATRTGNGVTSLLRFWLGDSGFGPFLNRFATGEIEP